MYIKYPLESIVTSFLFLSRVWSRQSDVICEGGRGEGDKWFDGCKWCICQKSGPLCSSAECSDLVSQVPPCKNVGSRWSDGCYHCKCHKHGIECAADRTCVTLMGNKRYGKDFLTRGACVEPKDNRCICGIDGVPSCTAEVIDRNVHPAITVDLGSSFPSSARLVAPSNVYYERSVRNIDETDYQYQRSQYYSPSYSEQHPRNRGRYIQRHSLTKRQAYPTRRHSSDSYDYRKPRYANYDTVYNKRFNRLQRRKINREFREFNKYLLELNMKLKQRRSFEKYPEASRRYLKELRDYRRRIRSGYARGGQYKPYTFAPSEPFARNRDDIKRQLRALDERKKRYRAMTKNVEDYYKLDSKRRARAEIDDMPQGDQPYNGDDAHIPPSLLVASHNRCRFGVRWYGGSLRCYCDQDNSITCGDPSFVASRIDGFRLEKAPCEEGHVWEEEDSCRECECQMSGVVLCRRSDNCPLPFLIKAVSVDNGGEIYYFDRKDFDSTGKGRGNGGGRTDEFRGQEEGTIDWNKGQESDNRKLEPGDSKPDSGSKNENIGTDDNDSSNSKTDTDENNTSLSKNDNKNSAEEKGKENRKNDKDNMKPDEKGNTDKNDNIQHLDTNSTNSPEIVIDPTEKSNTEKKRHNSEDSNNNSKRTTVVTVLECKPGSRWLDGCKRCKCSPKGKKDCDTSRCLHAGVFIPDFITEKVEKDIKGGKRLRPMQRPPSFSMPVRDRPVSQNTPFNLDRPCGRFRVSQVYWSDCNLCMCTPHGPKCTAKSCG